MEFKLNALFIIKNPQAPFEKGTEEIRAELEEFIRFDKIYSLDDYHKLPDKHAYDLITISPLSPFSSDILRDQMAHSTKLRWVHSLSVGIDIICKVEEFKNNDTILLTNAKGAFSEALAEHVVLGLLYHTLAFEQSWGSSLSFASDYTLGVVGYGDIGS